MINVKLTKEPTPFMLIEGMEDWIYYCVAYRVREGRSFSVLCEGTMWLPPGMDPEILELTLTKEYNGAE